MASLTVATVSTSFRSFEAVPGWELVSAGLDDLAAGRLTVAALVVSLASERLAALGIPLPAEADPDASTKLYQLLIEEMGEGAAHGRYNALRRRLLSFVRSAAHAPTD